MKTPVLFLIFNRLDTTKKVFESIRAAKIPKLYIASDGHRPEKIGEQNIVHEVRNYILDNIDWECETYTLFRDENLGCKEAVSSAITWFFENEDQGIILEDDCLPDNSFLKFCEDLLDYYKDDKRIWHIGGTNPIDKNKESSEYYFSNYNRIWGWATWRRAWQFYDKDIKEWPKLKKSKILYSLLNAREARTYEKILDEVYNGKIDTWDYQWFLARLLQGKAIIPKVNLISNIGFGEDATHTLNAESKLANLVRGKMKFPITHPYSFITDIQRDKAWMNFTRSQTNFGKRILSKLF